MTLATDKILGKIVAGIGCLTFNNPERRNAVTVEMWQAVSALLTEFENDSAVRVVVVRGAGGRSFVSGSDITQFEDQRRNAEQSEAFARHSSDALHKLAEFGKPVIAMIQGYCIGGGVRVAGCADIRIAADDAVFAIPAGKLGLGYSFDSAEQLAGLVGPSFAKEMLFTGRRFSADDALRIGLVNHVVPRDRIEAIAMELAGDIARNAPLTLRAAKIAVNQSQLAPEQRDMARVEASIRACFDSRDYAIGRKAFKEKRTPDFTGS
jgi:enoyl-CoA hydratase